MKVLLTKSEISRNIVTELIDISCFTREAMLLGRTGPKMYKLL